MRSRYSSTSNFAYSFGPGPVTPAIKAIMIANVAAFLVALIVPAITLAFGLRPADVVGSLHVWQLVTYMFLHGGVFHILFNMLALWMFGVELERVWGSRYFLKYYFVCGVGAAVTMLVLSFIIMWVRFSYPRLREDQLQRFAWKVLIPVSLVNIMITAILKVAF